MTCESVNLPEFYGRRILLCSVACSWMPFSQSLLRQYRILAECTEKKKLFPSEDNCCNWPSTHVVWSGPCHWLQTFQRATGDALSYFILLSSRQKPNQYFCPSFSAFFAMDVGEKWDFWARKFLTRHQYKGRGFKCKQGPPVTGDSSAVKTKHGNGNAPDLDSSRFI